MSQGHDCPGGCGRTIVNRLYACLACWLRLPPDVRERLTRAIESGDEATYITARDEAVRHYQAHPRTERSR